MSVVYDGQDIVVLSQLEPTSDRLIISFSARNGSLKKLRTPAEEMTGPGQAFLQKCGLPAVMFCARWNHWWQTSEMDAAISILDEQGILDRYRDIVTYGMSMGGYGALMFSKKLRATSIVAIAPQYTADPHKFPAETRWAGDRRNLTFIYDDMEEGLVKNGDVAIFYDPRFILDNMHATKVGTHREWRALLVPMSTHTVGRTLNDFGVLSSNIESALLGKLSGGEFRVSVRAARASSPVYLSNLARVQMRRKRPSSALRMSKRAMEALINKISTNENYFRSSEQKITAYRHVMFHFELLCKMDHYFEAIEHLESWNVMLEDWSNTFKIAQSYALSRLGRDAEALELAIDSINAELLPSAEFLRNALRLFDSVEMECTQLIEKFDQKFGNEISSNQLYWRKMAELVLKKRILNLVSVYFGGESVSNIDTSFAILKHWALTLINRQQSNEALEFVESSSLTPLLSSKIISLIESANQGASLKTKFSHDRDERVKQQIVRREDMNRRKFILDKISKILNTRDKDAIMKFDLEHKDFIVRQDLLSLRFAGILERFHLADRAAFYYINGELPSRSKDIFSLIKRKVIGICRTAGKDAATVFVNTLEEQYLHGDETPKLRTLIETFINTADFKA
ncbi:hypothetical protein [Methylobacterium sp.]|uniref:hypothetical protein n=1 Tax=Methylobacterium sp. TaxID=409 RepID=UPI003B5B3080